MSNYLIEEETLTDIANAIREQTGTNDLIKSGDMARMIYNIEGGSGGVSPTINVTEINGGHTVSVTDKNGTQSFNVMNGNGIKNAILNADYTLTLTFDDDTTYTTPSIRGQVGATGGAGKDGTDGVGIASIKQTTTSTADGGNNVFTVTLTNGTSATFTVKNGTKGSAGTNGTDGISPTVTTSKSGKVTTLTITDKNGTKTATISDGVDGAPGQNGYTPVAGVDYYTEADKAEIKAYITEELTKRGQLKPEKAESLEWLEANGDRSKIYVLMDKDDPNYGFLFDYTLTKTEVEGGPSYTNLLPTATDTDRKTIYGGDYNGDGVNDGYATGKRLSSSGGESAKDGCCCSGFISAKAGDVLRVKYADGVSGTSTYVIAYDNSNTKTNYKTTFVAGGLWPWNSTDPEVIYKATLTSADFGDNFNAIRLSGVFTDKTIITINEEIKEGGGTTVIEEYKWANTNLAFISADYGDIVADHERRIVRNTEKIAALQEAVESNGSNTLTEAEKIEKIKTWDKPVYDHAEVTLIADGKEKPALTTNDRTIAAIYAKYRALMAAHPDFITETNLGKCTGSDTFTAVDMLRFDFKERDGLTQPDLGAGALHETKPKLIFMSGVHTEWVGVWGLYYALEEITTNPAFEDIRRNCHIIVVPCANPFCLTSQTAIEGWRMSHVNANGVAIHNNFNVDHSTSGAVGEYNYGGTKPCSELETQYIDKIMADNSDAVAFVSCHNNDYSTYYGSHVIWASSATYHMCNLTFRLVDKMSKAWINKYGQTLKNAIDEYKINMDADDYRLGRATMSSSKGTEQKNALKYGIQGVNVEISRMMKIFSGNTDGTSEVMTHGAEVYANLIRTIFMAYENSDKKAYYE